MWKPMEVFFVKSIFFCLRTEFMSLFKYVSLRFFQGKWRKVEVFFVKLVFFFFLWNEFVSLFKYILSRYFQGKLETVGF
jgi:hypothetical protein